MSIRAILTTLILGSSTIALAQPADVNRRDDDRWERRDRDRNVDHDRDRDRTIDHDRDVRTNNEISLMTATHLARRLELDINGRLDGMSMLRIEPRGGKTHVDSVTLVYSDSRAPRSIRLDKTIRTDVLQVPLVDSKDIARVIVTGHSDRDATIAVDAF